MFVPRLHSSGHSEVQRQPKLHVWGFDWITEAHSDRHSLKGCFTQQLAFFTWLFVMLHPHQCPLFLVRRLYFPVGRSMSCFALTYFACFPNGHQTKLDLIANSRLFNRKAEEIFVWFLPICIHGNPGTSPTVLRCNLDVWSDFTAPVSVTHTHSHSSSKPLKLWPHAQHLNWYLRWRQSLSLDERDDLCVAVCAGGQGLRGSQAF